MMISLSGVGAAAIYGLGAGASVARAGVQLTPTQIYQEARGAGFPPSVAVQMTAIALRESQGWTGSVFTGATGSSEYSTGLWQINTQDPNNRSFLERNGITVDMLTDPSVNAKAAYLLWGGNPRNLDTAWYITRPGYREGYEAQLPVAEAAAQQIEGGYVPVVETGDLINDGGGIGSGSGSGGSDGGGMAVEIPGWLPAALAAAAGYLVVQSWSNR